MVDFAKYAFNKSHAAAYAVIGVQTAWLKYNYPVEFMAALMTSVIDNSTKASEYLYHCREMNIEVLPPDINAGQGVFTTEDGKIRYGLYAIKAIGRPVVDKIIEERRIGGPYRTLQDFIERVAERDINKRAIENLIKAGACDSLDGTRKQMAFAYAAMVDQVTSKKKTAVAGQMSLFDMVSDEEKKSYEIQYQDVGEFPKEMLLGFEKEVLGIYLTGHPLEEHVAKIQKNINAVAADFLLGNSEDGNREAEYEESQVRVKDNQHVIVGGLISQKKISFTKNNKTMAYISIEDLTGAVEVIIFPRDYERYQRYLNEDEKVFVVGHASVEDDKDGKIICERIVPFDETGCDVWLQFATMEEYKEKEKILMDILYDSDGNDEVVLYIAATRQKKRLGKNQTIKADGELLATLGNFLGEKNVKVVEKSIEN